MWSYCRHHAQLNLKYKPVLQDGCHCGKGYTVFTDHDPFLWPNPKDLEVTWLKAPVFLCQEDQRLALPKDLDRPPWHLSLS